MGTIISVHMDIDESTGYLRGQRLAHERPDLTVLVLNQYADVSWFAQRRRFSDLAQYRRSFRAGFMDELGRSRPSLAIGASTTVLVALAKNVEHG